MLVVRATLDVAEARRAIGRLLDLTGDLHSFGRAIGVGLVRNTQDRMVQAVDPSGRSWPALSPLTLSMKRGPGKLRERGILLRGLTFRVDGAGADVAVHVGSNMPYAAVHQRGATIRAKNPSGLLIFRDANGKAWGGARSVTIPARPYLGFSGADARMVTDAAQTALANALRR